MYSYSYDNMKRITQTEKGKEIVKQVEEFYEREHKGKVIPTPRYSDYKLIYLTGDRANYQKDYFDRLNRLMALQILAVADDKYLSDLEDVLASICDSYTWILPAHNLLKDNTFDYTIIDLFSAETAFYLAETSYVFGDKLTQDIRNRIKASLKSKIIDNYESRQFLFDTCDHNWAAVCSCGIGATYLYQFPERFDAVKDRIFNSMNNFLSGLDDEGYCSEGVGYWEYGFGMFALFHDIYVQLKEEVPYTLKNPKVKKTLKYINNAYLGDGFILPFADGGFKEAYFKSMMFYPIKNLFGDDFNLPPVKNDLTITKALGFRMLMGIDKFGPGSDGDKKNETIYYKKSNCFIKKSEKYTFTAKCGTNGEKHNHNDVGCFDLISGKKKIISDLGAGEYTWEYHNVHTEEGRYSKKIFVCGSWGHSVPIVNSRPQKNGRRTTDVDYGGTVISVSDNYFESDIAKAYEGGVDELKVAYTLLKNEIDVDYDVKGLKENIAFRFITEIEPEIIDGGVKLGKATLKSFSGINPKIEKWEFSLHDKSKGVAYSVDFEVNKGGNVKESFKIKL